MAKVGGPGLVAVHEGVGQAGSADAPNRAGTRAITTTPPIRDAASLMPDASPRSASPIAASTAAVRGVTATPVPRPHSRTQGGIAVAYPSSGCATDNKNATATTATPATIIHRGPNRATSAPLTGASTRKAADSGISEAPA